MSSLPGGLTAPPQAISARAPTPLRAPAHPHGGGREAQRPAQAREGRRCKQGEGSFNFVLSTLFVELMIDTLDLFHSKTHTQFVVDFAQRLVTLDPFHSKQGHVPTSSLSHPRWGGGGANL